MLVPVLELVPALRPVLVLVLEVAAFHEASFLERHTQEQCPVVLDIVPSTEVVSARWKAG
jgi:hypothetical protein